MKKIVLIEKLSITSLVLIVFFKFFFEKVYYREIYPSLQKEWILKLLEGIGINCLIFQNKENDNYINSSPKAVKLELKAFDIRKKLELNFIKNYFENNSLCQSFLKKYDTSSEKLKLCIRGELQESHLHVESQSIILIENKKILNNRIIYYYSNKISSYLLLNHYHKNLKISSIPILTGFFTEIFSRIFSLAINKFKNISMKKISHKKLKNNSINLENFEIAFLPHNGLKYGGAYSKNFYYSNDESSKLNKKNILNILRTPPDLFTKKFFSFWNMPNIFMNNYKDKVSFSRIIFFCKKISFKQISSIYELILFFFISKMIIKIENNLFFFENLPRLKIILCDFDVLFEKTILIACDIKKIKTASIQERYSMNTLVAPLFFNYYFIGGEKFEPFFKKYGYIVDQYYPIGTKSSLKKNKKRLLIKSEYLRLNNIKKKKILFVGVIVMNKFYKMLEGETGSTIENNIFFIKELINISKRFKDLHFILRFKMYKNFELLPKTLIEELKKCSNIEFDPLEKVNIYDLLSLCDLIVGRQSTLIEEGLSDDIPAIILDEINFFSNYNSYPLNKLILTAKNSKELNTYFDRFYEGKSLYSPELKLEIGRYLLSNKDSLDFKSKLQNILEEII